MFQRHTCILSVQRFPFISFLQIPIKEKKIAYRLLPRDSAYVPNPVFHICDFTLNVQIASQICLCWYCYFSGHS